MPTEPLPPAPRAGDFRRMLLHLTDGRTVLDVVDDGYRLWVRYHDGPALNVDRQEWMVWGDYKQFDLPGIGQSFCDTIWSGLRAMGGQVVDHG